MNLVFSFPIQKIIYCASEHDLGLDIRTAAYIMSMEKVYVAYSVGINFIDRSNEKVNKGLFLHTKCLLPWNMKTRLKNVMRHR